MLKKILLSSILFIASANSAEWLSRDVGAEVEGKCSPLGTDGFDIQGSGRDMWNAEDGLHFLYREWTGDFDIRARVASLQNTHEWAKAGVIVRQTEASGCAEAYACVTPGHGFIFQYRSNNGNANMVNVEGGPLGLPNCWVRLVRSGDLITGYKATDDSGQRWERIGSNQIQFSGKVFVGLFVCSHSARALCKAEFRKISLTDGETATASKFSAPEAAPATSERSAPASRPAVTNDSAEYKPADPMLAAAFASAAAKLAAENKTDKARDLCLRALANDENCAEALFELGKILEKDGEKASAGNFLARACRELSKSQDSAANSKRLDAERRLQTLNPHAMKLTTVLTDYAADISATLKKFPDAMTMDEANDRVSTLRLRNFVPPDKLPKSETAAKTTNGRASAVNSVPPDVERALKQAGWASITGSWTKKSDNVYEVSHGKLSANMINGAMQLILHKGGSGTVKAFVRNAHTDYYSSYYSYGSGYGVSIEGNNCKLFTPYNYSGMIYRPSSEREVSLQDLPKSLVLITINDGNLEITVNGKREHRSNYKLKQEGPFVIEVDGTYTIESPAAKGQ